MHEEGTHGGHDVLARLESRATYPDFRVRAIATLCHVVYRRSLCWTLN